MSKELKEEDMLSESNKEYIKLREHFARLESEEIKEKSSEVSSVEVEGERFKESIEKVSLLKEQLEKERKIVSQYEKPIGKTDKEKYKRLEEIINTYQKKEKRIEETITAFKERFENYTINYDSERTKFREEKQDILKYTDSIIELLGPESKGVEELEEIKNAEPKLEAENREAEKNKEEKYKKSGAEDRVQTCEDGSGEEKEFFDQYMKPVLEKSSAIMTRVGGVVLAGTLLYSLYIGGGALTDYIMGGEPAKNKKNSRKKIVQKKPVKKGMRGKLEEKTLAVENDEDRKEEQKTGLKGQKKSLERYVNTAVRTRTKKEFVELMKVYRAGGWKWSGKELPKKGRGDVGRWNRLRSDTCIGAGKYYSEEKERYTDGFRYGSKDIFENNGYDIISTNEFYRREGLTDKVEPRYYYQIKEGDYLSKIAKKITGESQNYHELARVNDIDDPNLIYPNHRVRIPEKMIKNKNRLLDRGVLTKSKKDLTLKNGERGEENVF